MLAGFFIISTVCSYTLAVFASLALESPFMALENILLGRGEKRNDQKPMEKTEEEINGTMNGKTTGNGQTKTGIDQEAFIGDLGYTKEKLQQNGHHIAYFNSGFDNDNQLHNNLNDLPDTETLKHSATVESSVHNNDFESAQL